jgi:hypothetical protein
MLVVPRRREETVGLAGAFVDRESYDLTIVIDGRGVVRYQSRVPPRLFKSRITPFCHTNARALKSASSDRPTTVSHSLMPSTSSPAPSLCRGRPSVGSSGHVSSGCQLSRVKRHAPITCRHGWRRKGPLHSSDRSERRRVWAHWRAHWKRCQCVPIKHTLCDAT